MPACTHGNIAIHYRESGSGEPVLLVHGLGSRGSDWQPQVEALAGRYRVIAVDLRGHGDSDVPPGPYSMSQFADDLLAVLDHLALPRVHLVGFSLGGMAALQLALDHPSRLRSLCLVNSGPRALEGRLRRVWELGLRTAMIRLLGMPRLGRLLASRLFPLASQAALAEQFVAQLSVMPRRAYLDSLRALRDWDVSERLGELRIPALVVAADGDYTPVASKRSYAARMPDARVAVVLESRHATPLDQPGKLNALLLEFFSGNSATRASLNDGMTKEGTTKEGMTTITTP